MPGHVRDIDHGWGKLRKQFSPSNRDQSVFIGIQGENVERSEGGATNAEIGTYHEFGAPNAGVPERSFLRATLDANGESYARMLQTGAGHVVDGRLTVTQLLGLIGEKVVADVRKRMKSGIAPDLKPATIRRKTRADGAVANVPLILTGQLLRAITWAIRPRNSGAGQ